MNKLISCLVFSFLFIACLAQTDKEDITGHYEKYWELTQNKDVWGTMDYMYPRLFELAPKKAMVEAINGVYDDTTMILGYSNGQLKGISDVLLVDEVKYALVNYSFTMSMTLNQGEDEPDDETVDLMKDLYHQQFGKENVRYQAEKKQFDIDVDAKMYAIKADDYDTWKFIENKAQYKSFFEEWFPKKVLKKLK